MSPLTPVDTGSELVSAASQKIRGGDLRCLFLPDTAIKQLSASNSLMVDMGPGALYRLKIEDAKVSSIMKVLVERLGLQLGRGFPEVTLVRRGRVETQPPHYFLADEGIVSGGDVIVLAGFYSKRNG
jgi:hypothetical protein